MLSITIFALMFTGAFLTALLAVSFYWASVYVRARRAGGAGLLDESGSSGGPAVLRGSDLSTIRVWGALLERFSHVEQLRKLIAEADLPTSVGRVTLLMLMGGTGVGLFLWQVEIVPFFAGVFLAGLAAAAPYFYIRAVRRRRFRKFAGQFPEALDSLTRALKAGYPLAQGMELLAMEQPEPLASEMRKTKEEWNLGVGWDQALDHLTERVPLPEVSLFAAAVKMQNRFGGRLNDVLGRLGETMREHAALDGEVRSISAHSRITGLILTILPVVIAAVLFWINPEYMSVMLRRPEGRAMLGAAVIANIAAHFVIKRVAQVKL